MKPKRAAFFEERNTFLARMVPSVEDELKAPAARLPRVRSLWQLDHRDTGPRRGCTAPDYRISFGPVIEISEHDCVVLTADLPDEARVAGDVGTVVHVHKAAAAHEVEFTSLDGHTLTVATVESKKIRPVSRRDVSDMRELQPAQQAV